jgi:ketosteroid isomerase-like protein
MKATSPEAICRHFQRHMRQGSLELLLGLYDSEAVFLNEAGETKTGEELRRELAPFAAARTALDYEIKQVIRAGEIALMHTRWKISTPQQHRTLYAVEVARRQADGSWRWLIGDPFTVGRNAALVEAN